MTHAVHPETSTRLSSTARHWLTAVLAIVGVVAAALGTWLAYGPDAGTLRIFGWTWNTAEISELWASWLLIGGGLLASVSMGWEAIRATDDTSVWVRALEGLILIAGLVAIAVGVILLF